MPPRTRPVALITGAARRIGRAIAIGLASDGWDVAVHYRASRQEAEATAAECRRLGVAAAALPCDLSDVADLDGLVGRCRAALGVPTLLVNNASEFHFDDLATLTAAGWDRHQSVNVRAPILLAQSFARSLPAGDTGAIINMIDQRVWAPTPEFFAYTASKVALWGATRMLAQALAPRIRVNAIGPGPTLQGPHQSAAGFAAEAAATPLQRATTLAEISAAVRFILDAPAMTGQMIALDGGQHLRWLQETAPSAPPPPVSNP